MSVLGASQAIREAVLSWPDTTARPHAFGGTQCRLGRREIGHVQGDELVDIPLPRRVRDEVVDAGKAEPHHNPTRLRLGQPAAAAAG